MKKQTKRNIFIGIVLAVILILTLNYLGLASILGGVNCAYVDAGSPDREYGSGWNCAYIWKPSYARELFWKFDLGDDLVQKVNNGELRITSATINEDFVDTSYSGADSVVDFYRTTNNWDKNDITFNNKPAIQGKIGEAYNPAGMEDITLLSSDFENNLLNFIKSNINNGESELSFVLVHGGDHDHNLLINRLQVILETEESQTYYKLTNNNCEEVQLFPEEIGMNDYETLEQCQANIDETIEETPGEEPEESIETDSIIIITISLRVIALGLAGFYLYRRYK